MEPITPAPVTAPVTAAPPVFLPPGSPPPPRPAPILPIDENGVVNEDVLCRKCSYNVRGLHQHARCPECGTPVGLSIRGNLLCYSDPDWVDKLSRGIDLILWGLLAGLLSGVAGSVVLIALGPKAQILAQIIGVAGSMVGFIGAWLLTTPDPGTEEAAQMVKAGKIVRFAMVFGMIENVLSIATTGEHPHPLLSSIFGVGLVIASVIGVIGEIARLYYLEKLALRIPDEALARRAHVVRWGYGISLAVAGIFGAVLTLVTMTLKKAPQTGWMPLMMAGACITGAAGLVALGFMIVYIIMLFQLRKILKAQSQFARETWAAASAPSGNPAPQVQETA